MRRKRSTADDVVVPAPQAVAHVIHEHAVYFPDAVQTIFRLRRSTIRREVREGRLRIAKRAGRYYLLGAWLLEWLRGGEVNREAS